MSTLDHTSLVFCGKCKRQLPRSEFNKNRRNKNHLQSWCRSCQHSTDNYYSRNRERILALNKEKSAAYYKKNKEKIKARVKEYQKTHKAKDLRKSAKRTRKRSLPYKFGVKDWRKCLDYFNHRCAVCGRPQGLWHTLAADHWIPLADSNCPGTIPTNIIPLCHGIDGCNNSKRDQNAEQWLTEKYGKRKARQILARIQAYFDSFH